MIIPLGETSCIQCLNVVRMATQGFDENSNTSVLLCL